MVMDTKILSFLLVGVVVGAGVGIGVGYLVFDDDKYDAGHAAGHAEGYEAGQAEGYDAGYADGLPEAERTYYFYLDFEFISGDGNGFEFVSEYSNMWISARAGNAVDALKAALDAAGLDYSLSPTGWVYSIGDPISDWIDDGGLGEGDGTSWISWFWASDGIDDWRLAWRTNPGFDNTLGTIFYLGFTYVLISDDGYWDMLPELNPNHEWSWITADGDNPFA